MSLRSAVPVAKVWKDVKSRVSVRAVRYRVVELPQVGVHRHLMAPLAVAPFFLRLACAYGESWHVWCHRESTPANAERDDAIPIH